MGKTSNRENPRGEAKKVQVENSLKVLRHGSDPIRATQSQQSDEHSVLELRLREIVQNMQHAKSSRDPSLLNVRLVHLAHGPPLPMGQ